MSLKQKFLDNKKKILLGGGIALGVIAVVVGAIFIARAVNQRKIDVYPVERIREWNWGDQQGSYGSIMAGNVQNVYADSNLLISKINVEPGQRVSVGDTLVTYDTTVQSLDLESKELNIRILENKITKAERELGELEALRPSSAPAVPNGITERVNGTADSVGGTGTKADPYVFVCWYNTAVNRSFLNTFNDDPLNYRYAVFKVYYDNNKYIYDWNVSGETLPDGDAAQDWGVGDGVVIGAGGAIAAPAGSPGFSFVSKAGDVNDGPHYSQQEINGMITDKKAEIASYNIDLKQAKLDYQIAKEALSEGVVKSKIDGVVSVVESPDTVESGKPIVVVQSAEGYSVVGAVSEFNLGKIEVGQEVYITSWSLGSQLVGKITQISSLPSPNYYGSMGQENPNSSYYQFTAVIDTTEVLMLGDWVEIYFAPNDGSGSADDTLYLPLAFVREDDGGSYVMKTDENDRLTKQYVKTGKTLYGYAIEIKAGVSLSDRIAFPYGKHVKEGAPTVEAEGYYY